jgi:phosphotransferase system HPr (HPr) family protein
MYYSEKKIMLSKDLATRYISYLVENFEKFSDSIYFISDDRCINAKSVVGMLSLRAKQNDEITVKVCSMDKDRK